jgi:hypothetical protein
MVCVLHVSDAAAMRKCRLRERPRHYTTTTHYAPSATRLPLDVALVLLLAFPMDQNAGFLGAVAAASLVLLE